jgi:hypothetical protein
MRTLFFFFFLIMSLSAEAQVRDTLPPWFKADILFNQLNDYATGLRPAQKATMKASISELTRSAPKNLNARQLTQLKVEIRKVVTQNLDREQLARLKAKPKEGGKDALDRIIDQSTTRRQ